MPNSPEEIQSLHAELILLSWCLRRGLILLGLRNPWWVISDQTGMKQEWGNYKENSSSGLMSCFFSLCCLFQLEPFTSYGKKKTCIGSIDGGTSILMDDRRALEVICR